MCQVGRPKEYDDALRTRLVSGAADAVADGGIDGVSLRALATAAGTSTNAIYTLFGSRAGLLGAVLAEAASSFTAAQRTVPLTCDATRDFRLLGRAYRDWALEHQSLYSVMFGERSGALWQAAEGHGGASEDSAGESDSAMGPLLDHIRHGQALKVLRAAEPQVIATVIWATVHGFVSLEIAQWSHHPRGERDARYEECLSASHAYWASAQTRQVPL